MFKKDQETYKRHFPAHRPLHPQTGASRGIRPAGERPPRITSPRKAIPHIQANETNTLQYRIKSFNNVLWYIAKVRREPTFYDLNEYNSFRLDFGIFKRLYILPTEWDDINEQEFMAKIDYCNEMLQSDFGKILHAAIKKNFWKLKAELEQLQPPPPGPL